MKAAKTGKPKAKHPSDVAFTPVAQITPAAFYMELTTTTGKAGNIPGEQRIPLEAIYVAAEFWGWPDNYEKVVNPRKGVSTKGADRVYRTWKPVWRILEDGNPNKDVTKAVRMYMYEQ